MSFQRYKKALTTVLAAEVGKSIRKTSLVLVDKRGFFRGADYGARTRHLDLGKVALYQMS